VTADTDKTAELATLLLVLAGAVGFVAIAVLALQRQVSSAQFRLGSLELAREVHVQRHGEDEAYRRGVVEGRNS